MSETKIANALVQVRSWWAAAHSSHYFRMGVIGALIVLVLDQASKFWIVEVVQLPARRKIEISGIFDLSYVENFGASFGMLSGGMVSRVFLSMLVASVAIGLVIWLGKLRRPVATAGVAFILGGALGNLYDRIAYGYVIDFLDFSGVPFLNFNRIPEFPYVEVFMGGFIWVFNVADAAINIGVALLLLDAWNTRERKPPA